MDFINNSAIPNLDIGDRKGWTDYIDFIKGDEIKFPVMKGIDIFKRPFLVFRVKVGKKIYSQTFFQRYSNGCSWQTAKGGNDGDLMHSYGGMNSHQFDFINELVSGKNPIITENVRPIDLKLIGKRATLYNEKKEKAAIMIQRNWNKCRWDPLYKMCEIVTMRNIEILQKEFLDNIF